MISWGTKRKLKYIFSTGFFFLFIVAAILAVALYERPNCSDRRQNGDEQGIDCGGSCSKLCGIDSVDLRVDWVRTFKVKGGVYSIAAYLENSNVDYQAQNVSYKFKIYDSKNTLISEPSGTAFIPAGQSFGIFKGGIFVGDRVPVRAVIEWQGKPNWTRMINQGDPILIKDVARMLDDQGLPKISAVIENTGLKTITNVIGFVVVYDSAGNAIASSQTLIDQIIGGDSENMVFSWPAPFSRQVGRVEILHWIYPSLFN